jgi:hypothetical protein
MDNINIYYSGKIYIIDKEPYETNEDVYMRGWYIVKNYNNFNYDELISMSKIYINEKNNMKY